MMPLLYAGSLLAQSAPTTVINRKQLFQQILAKTSIEEVRMDQITFAPGQGAPVHHHPCEVYGYVVSGEILYQPAGEEAVLLHTGDAFREAAGQEITAFKNAHDDKPATFVAIYLLKKNQSNIIVNQ
ncbi:quercetin dioxygenase-like cupin family protein [Chitinophaga niastensis]|uniref:Quercetin dioxygenase-like cupin family protein n=2 Tax=Chitinophaga niastensis TaxID=536980 RepID=A0A2P8HNU7_CHINA|nr:quercetin dioxygenase-like cupin family protein [Chitinophaga niastensis]